MGSLAAGEAMFALNTLCRPEMLTTPTLGFISDPYFRSEVFDCVGCLGPGPNNDVPIT